jgi:peroxiredoxin
VPVFSIAPDGVDAWEEAARTYGVATPVLSDAGNRVAEAYGVMRWRMGNEPGHTFVVVGPDGMVQAVRDYGAPENGGLMYVEPDEVAALVREALAGS